MITSNIILGKDVYLEKGSSLNNVKIGDYTKIAANVRIFGSEKHILEVGNCCYFGLNCIIEGFNAKVTIGNNVSFAQNVNLMSGSGPNASKLFQKVLPIVKNKVVIGDHTWIGASAVIMPGVKLGKFCVVGVNSYVNACFDDYSVIGGTPAKLIRKLTKEEIKLIDSSD